MPAYPRKDELKSAVFVKQSLYQMSKEYFVFSIQVITIYNNIDLNNKYSQHLMHLRNGVRGSVLDDCKLNVILEQNFC